VAFGILPDQGPRRLEGEKTLNLCAGYSKVPQTIPDYSSGHAWYYRWFADDQRQDQPRYDGHKRTAPGNAETPSGNLMLASSQSDSAMRGGGSAMRARGRACRREYP